MSMHICMSVYVCVCAYFAWELHVYTCGCCHSLVNMSTMGLHLLDNGGELGEQFLVSIQGEQVLLSKKEAKAVALCPAQAVA